MLNNERSNFLYYIFYMMLICIHYLNLFLEFSQMSKYLEPFVGYAVGASRSMQNLSSAVWAIFTPNDELMSFQGICVGSVSHL